MTKALVLAALAVAFASVTGTALTAPAPAAGGQSANVVSGYAISDVRYTPDANDPNRIAAVSFRLTPADATFALVRLTPGGETIDCVVEAGYATCPVGAAASFADASRLEVTAAR